MLIQVLLFAQAKSVAGQHVIELALSEQPTVGELRIALAQRFPQLTDLLNRSMIAVNQQWAPETGKIDRNDEVAWIPPVSGG